MTFLETYGALLKSQNINTLARDALLRAYTHCWWASTPHVTVLARARKPLTEGLPAYHRLWEITLKLVKSLVLQANT